MRPPPCTQKSCRFVRQPLSLPYVKNRYHSLLAGTWSRRFPLVGMGAFALSIGTTTHGSWFLVDGGALDNSHCHLWMGVIGACVGARLACVCVRDPPHRSSCTTATLWSAPSSAWSSACFCESLLHRTTRWTTTVSLPRRFSLIPPQRSEHTCLKMYWLLCGDFVFRPGVVPRRGATMLSKSTCPTWRTESTRQLTKNLTMREQIPCIPTSLNERK
jgi:hypothetical protein